MFVDVILYDIGNVFALMPPSKVELAIMCEQVSWAPKAGGPGTRPPSREISERHLP